MDLLHPSGGIACQDAAHGYPPPMPSSLTKCWFLLLPLAILANATDSVFAAGPTQHSVPPATRPVTFEFDVQPLLTRFGCNSGPCHGKSRGQNGFALSLLGFDSDFDYASLIHEGRGRRI